MTTSETLIRLSERIEWAYDKGEKELLESAALTDIENDIQKSLGEIIDNFGEDNNLRYKKLANGWRTALRSGFVSLETAMSKLVPWEKLMLHLVEEYNDTIEKSHQHAVRPQEYFTTGEQLSALKTITELFRSANTEISIIDNYLSPDVIGLMEPYIASNPNVKVRLLTKLTNNSNLNALKVYLKALKITYPNSHIDTRANDNCHDRFVIIDNVEVYHSGHSLHQLGLKASRLSKINNAQEQQRVINDFNIWWSNGTII